MSKGRQRRRAQAEGPGHAWNIKQTAGALQRTDDDSGTGWRISRTEKRAEPPSPPPRPRPRQSAFPVQEEAEKKNIQHKEPLSVDKAPRGDLGDTKRTPPSLVPFSPTPCPRLPAAGSHHPHPLHTYTLDTSFCEAPWFPQALCTHLRVIRGGGCPPNLFPRGSEGEMKWVSKTGHVSEAQASFPKLRPSCPTSLKK